MPRNFLPTPASSTDIKGQDGSEMASLQLAFELPPPAIIQMKPREELGSETATSAPTTASRGKTGTTAATAAAGTKRKEPPAASAAGRKMARKTAHSIIERRRRSKMNEEFAVLKSLIPACTGEMHKLAILQAAIEYVRYLEDCGGEGGGRGTTLRSGLPSPFLEDDDGRRAASPPAAAASPAPGPRDPGRNGSCSSVASSVPSDSALRDCVSPCSGPQQQQQAADREATAALLMLNQMDRRTETAGGTRGISVRDLLIS
ncbi:hypothetical protein VTH06DRAFT_4275 [Thermothelomyces fergusii]